ncbi:MAG: DUF481 domain-containing protein [Cryomorphaceae bacterium]|nr:DUF481 domain-containing protein [Flavobacteriales bacterium]
MKKLKPPKPHQTIRYVFSDWVKCLAFTFAFFAIGNIVAQNDSIKFNGNDVITGKVKQMKTGVLKMETNYSDEDFKIDWDEVTEFYSDNIFTINLSDRSLLAAARIETVSPGVFRIVNGVESREVGVDEIVYFRKLDKEFWNKLSASVDFGFRLTKANDFQQFNASANIGYSTDRWTLNSSYRQVRSVQDNTDPIRRVDGSATGDYLLQNGIFFGARLNFLSNSEQQIDLRTTGVLGAGYYIFRTNTLFWNGFLGAAINIERFEPAPEGEAPTGQATSRESFEGVVGTELSVFDLGNFDLSTSTYWYPGLSKGGRNRLDFRLDTTYDIAKGFYIKAGITLNYDSRPAAGGAESDYILLSGFGWSL